MQRLLTTTAFIVDEMDTIKEMWEAVMKDFTYRGAYCQTRLQREFMATHCPKNGDIKLFLHNLCAQCTELRAMGVTITIKTEK